MIIKIFKNLNDVDLVGIHGLESLHFGGNPRLGCSMIAKANNEASTTPTLLQ